MGTHPLAVAVGIVVVVLAVAVLSAVVVADETQSTEPAFVVELAESGDATVTLRVTFDLTTDQGSVFRTLEDDASNRTELYRQRLASVASETENATGREMSVTDPQSQTYTDGETGVLELSVRWNGLAATTADGVRLQQPFASGFTPPRRFVVTAPDGHEITTVSPDPATAGDGRVEWTTGTDLTGFVVATDEQTATATAQPTQSPAATQTDAPTPLASLLLAATLAAVGVGWHRRRA